MQSWKFVFNNYINFFLDHGSAFGNFEEIPVQVIYMNQVHQNLKFTIIVFFSIICSYWLSEWWPFDLFHLAFSSVPGWSTDAERRTSRRVDALNWEQFEVQERDAETEKKKKTWLVCVSSAFCVEASQTEIAPLFWHLQWTAVRNQCVLAKIGRLWADKPGPPELICVVTLIEKKKKKFSMFINEETSMSHPPAHVDDDSRHSPDGGTSQASLAFAPVCRTCCEQLDPDGDASPATRSEFNGSTLIGTEVNWGIMLDLK